MNTLQITNLQKTYPNGVKALDQISLSLGNGLFGLLGPNGAGKSSLMRTIAALQAPDSGSIRFNGTDVLKHPDHIRKNLGYLPREFGVYPNVSAYRLLDHLALLKGITQKGEKKEQVEALLHETNLWEHKHKAVSSFSGGMRQRFGIAQALLGDPKIIIADEPTAGLDPEERNRFHNLLSRIGEQIIVILSTHIVEDVKNLCPEMAIISKGRVLAQGTPAEFIRRLEGKLWACTIPQAELENYRNLNLLSTRLYAGKLKVQVLSGQQPAPGFTPIPADLEDVYFSALSTFEPQNR